ncbi:hypothetical protein BVX98_07880 [bacterium F11]|nr:hypothetical protein BVX98_07880 [bacterium F11]
MLLAAAFLIGEALCSSPSFLFGSDRFPVTITLPAASIDLSDLDVRDEYNRRVHSPALQRKMRSLFVSGLNTMLLFNLTPQKRNLLIQLAQTWDLVSGWIKNKFPEFLFSFDGWVQKKKEIVYRTIKSNITKENNKRFGYQIQTENNGNRFLYFLSNLLSSIVLLR